MQVNAMSHIPILPQNLWRLLKLFGCGSFGNLIRETMIKTIQIKDVVIDKNVWK